LTHRPDPPLEADDLESAHILEATLELAIRLLQDPKVKHPHAVPAGFVMVSLHLLGGPGGVQPESLSTWLHELGDALAPEPGSPPHTRPN
jgi:hypothetical protein